MDWFGLAAILLTITAVFSYINHRFIKLPVSIGLMLTSLVVALGLMVMRGLGWEVEQAAEEAIRGIDFDKLLLEGMLALLLFAGALHVNINDLRQRKWLIGVFATLGVIGSTLLIGGGAYLIAGVFGYEVVFINCLLFGALISPTDPIAVLAIMKKAKAEKSIETVLAGESLFNDGVGVVIFIVLLEIASMGSSSAGHIATLFAIEAGGGIVLGLALGYLAYRLLKSIDDYQIEIMITLALVFGGYSLAHALHTSGPIAMVVAGLLIGNHGRNFAMSARTRQHLDMFWTIVDGILNAILFVLIGLEVVVLSLSGEALIAGLILIPVVLIARFITVAAPLALLDKTHDLPKGATRILTWGGLRGGIAVALALSIPLSNPQRNLLLTITYVVVAFAILVQGTTIKRLIKPRREP
ncbi:MAG: sodium:proton antiporter [Sedimentisphaerales bacterium]|nr:sodium:proton antiporter [Sedimentisphaerales bacterium]